MRRFLTRDEWQAWADAGKPPMSAKQLRRACRSITLAAGNGLEPGDEYARTILAARDREAGVMTLARNAGAGAEEIKIMAGADVELRTMWLERLRAPEDSRTRTLADPRVNPEEATIMLDADPELRSLWLAQMADRQQPAPTTAPLGMDQDRYQLHTEAKALAATKLARDPRLDEGEAYILATQEIDDRKFAGPI
jgi:hypothetical protein